MTTPQITPQITPQTTPQTTDGQPSEARETAIRRMKMRSMRRGIKEMDLILSDFAGRALDGMETADLTLYDALLDENDHDIFGWVNGQIPVPGRYATLVTRIAEGATGIVRPGLFARPVYPPD